MSDPADVAQAEPTTARRLAARNSREREALRLYRAGNSQVYIAAATGLSKTKVCNLVRLDSKLHEDVLDMLLGCELPVKCAEEIAYLKPLDQIPIAVRAAERAAEGKLDYDGVCAEVKALLAAYDEAARRRRAEALARCMERA